MKVASYEQFPLPFWLIVRTKRSQKTYRWALRSIDEMRQMSCCRSMRRVMNYRT